MYSVVSTSQSFLGASHDGSEYDPSNVDQPYGFLEVKCPYKAHDITPLEDCKMPNFCCTLNDTTGVVKLHAYYCQIQGQMSVGSRPWYDFICTSGG